MQVIPAVDIHKGSCVQLVGGDVNRETLRLNNPEAQVDHFAGLGAKRMHLVDLDRALETGDNQDIIKSILGSGLDVDFQVGGGVRSFEDVYNLLSSGANKVISGTKALLDPSWLRECTSSFPDNMIVAVDAQNSQVVTHGWKMHRDVPAWFAAKSAQITGASGILYTDVSKEGRMQGPNVLRSFELANMLDIELIVSGGIRNNQDIADLEEAGADGVVLGTAAYTGQLALRELFG